MLKVVKRRGKGKKEAYVEASFAVSSESLALALLPPDLAVSRFITCFIFSILRASIAQYSGLGQGLAWVSWRTSYHPDPKIVVRGPVKRPGWGR